MGFLIGVKLQMLLLGSNRPRLSLGLTQDKHGGRSRNAEFQNAWHGLIFRFWIYLGFSAWDLGFSKTKQRFSAVLFLVEFLEVALDFRKPVY